MDRPVWLIFPYPDKVLRSIGNQRGLEMDSMRTSGTHLDGLFPKFNYQTKLHITHQKREFGCNNFNTKQIKKIRHSVPDFLFFFHFDFHENN